MCGQYCRSWSTCVKLTNNVPRSTHTYLVDHVLACGFLPVKTELMARYGNFYKSLLSSRSSEVQLMASIVTKDVRTTTAKNLALIRRECNVRTQTVAASEVIGCLANLPMLRLSSPGKNSVISAKLIVLGVRRGGDWCW